MNVTLVDVYVMRKMKRPEVREPSSAGAEEYGYQVVVVAVFVADEYQAIAEAAAHVALPRPEANGRLKKAMNDTAAEGVVKLIWKSDDLRSGDLTGLIMQSPELLRQATAELAKRAAGAAGVGALAVGPVPGVLANLAMEPVLSPTGELVHALEVAGVIVGVLIGDIHLAMICTKQLLYDSATSVLADAFAKAEARLEAQVENDAIRAIMIRDGDGPTDDLGPAAGPAQDDPFNPLS